MPRVLRIFDLSSYCHAGNVNKYSFIEGPVFRTSTGYRERDIPTGGASLLFNHLHQYYGTCDMIFCADRNPSIKKGMSPMYKSSRKHTDGVSMQKEVIERILKHCNFTVLADEGYEADDFMYSCVKKLKNQYDKVYVHTADSDMYFLVSENVEIAKTHSRTKEVNIENYPYSIPKSKYTPYNMSSFLKVLNGDPKDDIAPMEKSQWQVLLNMFDNDFMRPKLGDKDFLRATLEMAAPWALHQFDLVYPLDTWVPQDILPGNKARIKEWGYLMKNRYFVYPVDATKEVEQEIMSMVEDGLYIDRE